MDQSDERPGKIVHLAREVLHIAEAQHNQPESIDVSESRGKVAWGAIYCLIVWLETYVKVSI